MPRPLNDTLNALGLHHTATHLGDLVALATKRRWSPVQLLEHLVAEEQQERTRRSLERRLARARIVTVPGFSSAARVAQSRYAFGSTPQSFADSMRL